MGDSPSSAAGERKGERFAAEGAIVRPKRVWLAVWLVVVAIAIALLATGEILGLVLQLVASLAVASNLIQQPRKAERASIAVVGDELLTNGVPAARVEDIVGLSVVPFRKGHMLRVTQRSGRAVELVFVSDVHIIELRAALGMSLARAGSMSFRGHAPLGCIAGLASIALSIAMGAVFVSNVGMNSMLAIGLVLPLILMAGPLVMARMKTATVRCGDEGVHIERLIGTRFIRYAEILEVRTPLPTVITLVLEKRQITIELPSGDDAKQLLATLSQHASTPLPEADHDIAARLGRQDRSLAAWVEAIRAIAAPERETYRAAALPEDRLWTVVEDPAAEPTARIGAALALRARIGDDGKRRLRIAAEASALPEVRVSLVEVADEADDEALLETLSRAVARR